MSRRDVPRSVDEKIADMEERLRTTARAFASSPVDAQVLYDAKGAILVAASPGDPRPVEVGSPGSVLTANPIAPYGVSWEAPGGLLYTAKGDLLVGTGPEAEALLAVGADGDVLTADSGSAYGVSWVSGGTAADVELLVWMGGA